MFTSFILWLWAALLASPQPTACVPQPPTANGQQPMVFGDSTIFREIQTALARRAAETAPEKCYVHTDRTLLAPGDTLWWKAYVRNASDLLPSVQSQILYVELLDPRGSVIQQRTVLAIGGTAAGEFSFAASLPGGSYKLRAHTAWMQNTDDVFERDITLQKTVLPRLNLRLEWERKAVGPGETAIARFDAQSLDNKPLANRTFRYTAAVEGKNFTENTATTDAAGRAYIRFEMPKKLDSPDGLLNIQIEHAGQMEAISRAIPIVLNRIDLQFFPEGGDAVAGLPCRVAFKAVNEFGKAADVSGTVRDSRGRTVAGFSSWHNGMGAFDFQPKPGEQYTARLEQPAAAARDYDLPELRSQGFALHLQERTADNLTFQVNTTRPGKVYLVGMSGDKAFFFSEYGETPVSQAAQYSETPVSPTAQNKSETGVSPYSYRYTATIPTTNLPIGIARFTLFNEKKVEIAERLVFVNRDRGLRLEVKTDKPQYLPRETVRMSIRATDHTGWPVQGHFSLGVTDESLLTFADDKQGHLLSALLLEQDLRGKVEEPNFYFDTKEAKAEQALDHLLLTQGWRRFEWKEVLNPTPLVLQHQPERATVEGWFRDAQTGKPLVGQNLGLYPGGETVTTDSMGWFTFQNVDITHYRHIRDAQGGFHEIADFNSKMVIYGRVAPDNRAIQQAHSTQSHPSPDGLTVLMGKVTDEAANEDLIGASVKITQGGVIVRGAITDYNGDYRIALNPGRYDVEVSYTGYTSRRITGVNVLAGMINLYNASLPSGAILTEVTIMDYKVPLIKQDNTSSGMTMSMGGMGLRDSGGRIARSADTVPGRAKKEKTSKPVKVAELNATAVEQDKPATGQALTSDQIKNLPTRATQQIVATRAGTNSITGGEVNIRGSRSNATNYYVDGIRVTGVPPPVQDLETFSVITGGLGAEFGEPSQGVISTMDEVVVVGYATAPRRRDETGAISTIRFDAPERRSRRERVENDDRMVAKPAPPQPSIARQAVRQYTRARQFYVPKYSGPVSQRTDFRPTIYWNPDVRTNSSGTATVEFVTSDAITNFRATVEGISASGIPGRTEQQFFVEKPISVSVKVPHSVIAGDTLCLQVVLNNRTEYAVSGQFSIEMPNCFQPVLAAGQNQQSPMIAPKTSITLTRSYFVGASKNNENQPLSITFRSPEAFEDVLETQIRVLDRGFPVRHVLTANQAQNQFNLHLMEPVEGTVTAVLTAYPSALEDVLKGMERMLRQPSGCFEQVSSSNYPNLLVLDLLRSTGTARPEVESQARAFLEDGYKRLTGYESKSGGFDWYGRDPGHEGLTAYGLLEFTDMSRVFEVDKKMLDRTAKWLLSRRNGKGRWKVNPASLHGWQDDGVLDAYIAWSVAEAGYGKDFKTEIDYAYQQAVKSSDLYQIALLANALAATKDARAAGLISQLVEKQEKNGSWMGSSHSVLHAHGEYFRTETTALAALALMKSGNNGVAVSKALEFIMQRKNEYGYGSTQSTVLALRALVEYAKIGSQKPSDGQLVVQVDGKRVAEQPFSTQSPNRIEMAGLEQFFTHNDPRVEVFFESKNGQPAAVIPFDLEIKYASRLPRNTANCAISLKTELGKTAARVGETVRLSTVLKNESKEAVASPMVVLGIPAGLNLQPWQLKKLMDEKHCDFYELWDGYAVFHFEALAAGESRTLNLDLRADITGTFEAPASQAFLYYQNDQRVWSKPERLVVQ